MATDQAPSPAGPYSQAVRAGDFVFCAGQTPRDPDGTRLTGAPFVDQARQVFENLRQIAQAAEGELADVVKLTLYLSDPADLPVFNQVCTEYLGDPLPARTTVFCQLPGGATVEVEAVLWVPGREQPARAVPGQPRRPDDGRVVQVDPSDLRKGHHGRPWRPDGPSAEAVEDMDRLFREQLAGLLAETVRDGTITAEQGDAILTRFDAR
jgi:reactive intermediate/imine deaminase